MWKTLQQAHLYICTPEKLPGLQTQRKKCEVWQDQLFFHCDLTQQICLSNCVVELVIVQGEIRIFCHDAVRFGRTLVPCLDCVLKGEAIRVVHLETQPGTEKFVTGGTSVFGVHALGLLVTICANAVLPPPAFVGTISSGKCRSLNCCLGCTAKTRRAGFLNARSWFPSSTRANTTVDLNSA